MRALHYCTARLQTPTLLIGVHSFSGSTHALPSTEHVAPGEHLPQSTVSPQPVRAPAAWWQRSGCRAAS